MVNPKRQAIDVLIVDDHPILLQGLRQTFSEDHRFRVVAVASDGERLLQALDRLRADVIVMGWIMPYLDGAGVLRALRGRANPPKVVVYSGADDPDVPRQAMALGGAGFCSKRVPPQELLETVAAVAGGRMVFPFVDVRSLIGSPLGALTGRELEVLAALSTGGTVTQMARGLNISPNTLKFHIKNLYGKLRVSNRAQAVATYLTKRYDVDDYPKR
ncbi:MAG: response regulator transcription factor [Rhodospirillaceae bacterium]|nr:response regulator transcription factor [Rhodospirillaceae bacterium]